MRLLSILLLMFSSLVWGEGLPKENHDTHSGDTQPPGTSRFIWPTQGKVINGFDPTRKGIDIAGKAGQPVVAASDGKVLYASNMRGYGNLIILEHSDGMVTAYAHLQIMLVSEGQPVTQGQQIAEMGDSDADTIKLRFQIRYMGKPIDPVTLLPAVTNEIQISSQEKTNSATVTAQTDINRDRQQREEERLRIEEDRRRKEQQATIERERQQLAEERRRLEEEKRRQQAEKNNPNKQTTVTDSRRRLALVIGNSTYSGDSNFPPIPNAVNDARVISESLRSTGFRVSTYENLDHASMRNVIRIFGESLSKNDVGLVYYAGHGVQVKGKNYLIPVEVNIKKSFEVPSSAVDVEFLFITLEHIKNDLNIIVLDACRSSFPGERGATQGLALIEAAKGTFIAFSTAPGASAQDGVGSNSPYTKHLARLIGKKGLPLEQVFKEVRKAVVAETNGEQVPWENSSLMGDFYFQK